MFRSFSKLAGKDHGFSMAEVVIALFLFTASVLGISQMMVSSGANITLGSQDTTAQNLASKKIEEVKSLPFYTPYNAPAKRDIDDWFWDAGGYVSGNPPGSNASQPGNPKVEDYGTIPGCPNYKRTTSVQYMYVSGGTLAPAVMNSNWLPNGATGTKFDKPKGGVGPSTTADLHGCMIEVKVDFKSNSGTRSYMEHALAGDLMVTGGTNNPIMVVTGISPSTCDFGTSNNLLKIFVSATGLTTSSQVEIKLWYPGTNDVPSLYPATVVSASEINCHFTMDAAHGVRIGKYNLSVYWKDAGWLDKSYRENFEVVGLAAVIGSISNYTWGYLGQTRKVTITGDNLTGCLVAMKGPHSVAPDNRFTIPGTVDAGLSDQWTLVATFPLTGTAETRPSDSRFDFVVTTVGNQVTTTAVDDDDDNTRRFWMNPPPTVTSITNNPGSGYYNWGYRNTSATTRRVYINGEYLYGIDTAYGGASSLKPQTTGGTDRTGTVNTSAHGNDINSADCVYAIIDYAVSTSTSDCPNLKDWNVWVRNGGLGTVTSSGTWNDLGTTTGTSGCFRMNPQSKISTVTSPLTRKISNPVSIAGFYFQPSAGSTTAGLTIGSESVSGSSISVSSETAMTFTANLSIGQGTITVGGSDTEIGAWTVKVTNPDGQFVTKTTTVSHATPTVTSTTVNSGRYNYWGEGIGTVTGNYFDTVSGMELTYWYSTTCYDPFESAPTVEGTTSVGGSYGTSGQTISGNTLNLINIPTGWGWMQIKDKENGQTGGYSFNCYTSKPTIFSQTTDQYTRGVSISERCDKAPDLGGYTMCTLGGTYTKPWSHQCWSHFLGHSHHYYAMFRVRGKGMFGTVYGQPSNYDWLSEEYDSEHSEHSATTQVERVNKRVWADFSEWDTGCSVDGSNNLDFRVRNNSGDTGWYEDADCWDNKS